MKKFLILLPILGLHLFFLLNLQFTAWPEMFAYPYLKNNGFFLYSDIIHPYPPLLSVILAYIYKVFGYKIEILEAVTWLIILLSDLFIYLNSFKLTKNKKISLITLFVYVLLQPFLDGNMLWFDIAIVLPILVGTYFALDWIEQGDVKRNIFLAGLFLGASSLIKQTTGIFIVLFLAMLFISKTSGQIIFKFIAGASILWLVLVARIFQEGQIVNFWNWTVYYPLVQWKNFPGYVQMSPTTRQILVLAILLLPVLFFLVTKFIETRKKNVQLVLVFLTASLLAIYPRFSFFHFQTALAFFVLLYGYILNSLSLRKKVVGSLVFFVLFIPAVFMPMFRSDWQKQPRFYGRNEIKLASTVSNEIKNSRNIYLLGLPAQYYVMTNTVPPKPWTDNFGWYLEIPGLQEQIVSRWSQNPPDFIFWRTPTNGNWFDLGTYQPQRIVKWIQDNYTKRKEVSSGVWMWEKNK